MNKKYWPRTFEEMADDPVPVTFLNERLPPDNVIPLPKPAHSLHAVLVESLNNTQALLQRLELGVHAPSGEVREVIRELYVQTRHQVKALAAVLELDGFARLETTFDTFRKRAFEWADFHGPPHSTSASHACRYR